MKRFVKDRHRKVTVSIEIGNRYLKVVDHIIERGEGLGKEQLKFYHEE